MFLCAVPLWVVLLWACAVSDQAGHVYMYSSREAVATRRHQGKAKAPPLRVRARRTQVCGRAGAPRGVKRNTGRR
jgi:hypothetical protein